MVRVLLRSAVVAGAIAAVGLATATPALADGGPNRSAGTYDTQADCKSAGAQGVTNLAWTKWTCTQTDDGWRLDVSAPPATGPWHFWEGFSDMSQCNGTAFYDANRGAFTEWKCVDTHKAGPRYVAYVRSSLRDLSD